MQLKLVSLASGSKGNSILIYSPNTAILCDAGISLLRISRALKKLDMDVQSLSGVVVTHEHSDHICALPNLCKTVPLYCHPQTAKEIYNRQRVVRNYQEVDYYENGFSIGDIKVLPFRIPHDAVYPLGYTFVCGDSRVSVATDMGLPTRGAYNNIKDSQVVLLESNYDEKMLKEGSYPYPLKQRILSSNGHLSNADAAVIAERLVGTSVQDLVLGHLSENNNLPDIAYNTVNDRLKSKDSTIRVHLALQHEQSEVFKTE